MDQHAVPQNISSYEFRLVGDMTLKQFLQLAGGAAVGLVIYRLPLPDFIKWPLVIIAAGVGALMAFVPIQGRPFTQWLLAFIKAVYAPTEFYWKPLTVSAIAPPPPLPITIPTPTPAPKPTTPPPSPPPIPSPKPTTNNLQPTTPLSPAEVASFQTLPTAPVQPAAVQTQYAKASAPPPPPPAPTPAPKPTTQIPQPTPPSPTTHYPLPTTQLGPSPLTPTIQITYSPSSTGPTTTPNLPPPSSPNILTGLVVTSQNQPQEGAIVEIVANATGLPVRALRTSKAGTFQIATPLPNGSYSLYTDKDGLTFDSVSIITSGQIIQPIIIKAK